MSRVNGPGPPGWFGRYCPPLLALAALLGLAGYTWGQGPLTTSDSYFYLAAARSWASSGQLLDPNGSPYAFWAPLYPVLLALAGAPLAPALAVGLLHGPALLTAWAGWSWLGRRLLAPTNPGRRVLPWVLALSTPWLLAAKFVWSETWFLALFTAYAVALYGYLERHHAGWLLAATVAGVLLPLQRTSGLFLLAGAALGLGVGYGWRLWGQPRGALLLLHFLVSASAGVVWQLAVVGSGRFIPLVLNPAAAWGLQPLSDFSYVLTRWLLPWPIPVGPVPGGYLLAGLVLAATLVRGAALTGRFSRVLLITGAGYVGWHVLANVLSRGAAGIHDGERYVGVLFGPVFLLLFGALPAGAATWPRPRVLALALVLWLAYPAARAVRNSRWLHQQPPAALLAPPAMQASQPAK